MLASISRRAGALLILSTSVACGGGNAASSLATAPAFTPKDQTKCGIAKSRGRPLIVEWPAADRASLESHARRGLVAVRYDGCEMEILPRCRARGRYLYAGLTKKQDRVVMRDADDLYANIPAHAASFEAKLQKVGQLNVSMTIVGQYEADQLKVTAEDFDGECEGATHVVTALTAGAFEFYAGADAEVGGGAAFAGVGAGAKSAAHREILNRDGDDRACEKATTQDREPPEGCGALLRVEVAPLVGGKDAPARAHASPKASPAAATSPAWPERNARDDDPCPAGMRRIPSGSMMLSDAAPRSAAAANLLADGRAPRTVRVDSFCFAEYEVTASEYFDCASKGKCLAEQVRRCAAATYPNGGALPINCVSFDEAAAFCQNRGQRLPTEDEWEWAARGGPRAWTYPWGEDEPSKTQTALKQVQDGRTNPQGVRFLIGNVWEWTSTEIVGSKIIRGGSYSDTKPEMFVVRTSRLSRKATERSDNLGFRCAK